MTLTIGNNQPEPAVSITMQPEDITAAGGELERMEDPSHHYRHPNELAFVGWYLNAEGTGDRIEPWSYVPTGNVTLYAKWAPGNKVTYDANGGYFWDDPTFTSFTNTYCSRRIRNRRILVV